MVYGMESLYTSICPSLIHISFSFCSHRKFDSRVNLSDLKLVSFVIL